MPAASAIRVLVVDDQPSMRALVRSSLTQLGFTQVSEAVDGEDALRKMLVQKFHLVISDFNMPKLDGLGLLRVIRTDDDLKTTGFIMLTGRSDKDLVQRAVQFGVNNYLVKPFTMGTLKGKIEAVFGALT